MRFDGEIRIEDEKENDVKNNDEAKRFKCSGVVEIRNVPMTPRALACAGVG